MAKKRGLIDLEFPPGTVVRSCNRYRASEWTVAAKIETRLANDELKFYFLKVMSMADLLA
jgi:hypothetical protein